MSSDHTDLDKIPPLNTEIEFSLCYPRETHSTASHQENEGELKEHNVLPAPGNVTENINFYIDGAIVSTHKISNNEGEVHSGSPAVLGLDVLIGDHGHLRHILNSNTEQSVRQEGESCTVEPYFSQHIETELFSEAVVSSSFVSPFIENQFLQNSESTVFLTEQLKQLLEKQGELNSRFPFIAEDQKPSTSESAHVLPLATGRFKRRTSSPEQTLVSDEVIVCPDPENEGATNTVLHNTCVETNLCVAAPSQAPPVMDSQPPLTGGNSCNQKPLDLSNTVKKSEDGSSVDTVLDLSLQKRTPGEPELGLNVISKANLRCNAYTCPAETSLTEMEEEKGSLGKLRASAVSDFPLVTDSGTVTPMEPVAEGLIFGLALPPPSLTPTSIPFTPLPLESASPCAIPFASSHTMLPASSLITVLAPTAISNSSCQPIQILAPNISPEPMVICAENALKSQCDLTNTLATANAPNIVGLSEPLDTTLDLPGHMVLTNQITLNPPLLESNPVAELPVPPTLNISDSLFSPYDIASNTVLIECTVALEGPRNEPLGAINIQEDITDAPVPAQMVVNHIKQQQILTVPNPETVEPTIIMSSIAESLTLTTNTEGISEISCAVDSDTNATPEVSMQPPADKNDSLDQSDSVSESQATTTSTPPEEQPQEESSSGMTDEEQQTFTKNFNCNVCEKLFHSMKELGHHVGDHADEWPYKCEFCVLLFGKPSALLDHRSTLHGVEKTYMCSVCTKEFVYLCNLKQHQQEFHPGQQCTYTEDEKGILRPQNYNSAKVNTGLAAAGSAEDSKAGVKKEKTDVDTAADELFTTIKVMASDNRKVNGPDVRMGINQHYPSFKPPPFPYHNRTPGGSVPSATNFTTHNIPQTFTTAIRCTKCGKSFDNMPELHNHILACANASDKRRYTPRKNPIPLRHFAKTQNGVLSITKSPNGLNGSIRVSQANAPKPSNDTHMKLRILNKRKKKMVQRVLPQRNKTVSSKGCALRVDERPEVFACPHCGREFTMRRCKTKHMAVCSKKPQETRKRKDVGIFVTKENNRHLHRSASHARDRRQSSSPLHKTRHQTSGSSKRHAILPVQSVFSSKRSKANPEEAVEQEKETSMLSELPIRTFNPSMRQYSRLSQSVKGVPIKITVVRPQQAAPERAEPPPNTNQEEASGAISGHSEQSASV